MSTFEREYQRRLRAVLAKRTGKPVPADMMVTVESIASVGGYDEDYEAEMVVRLRGRVLDGRSFVAYDYEFCGDPVVEFMADILAVPEEDNR